MDTLRVVTWDWKAQPDLGEMNTSCEGLTSPKFYEADTGGDSFAWIISEVVLTPEDVQVLYDNWVTAHYNE